MRKQPERSAEEVAHNGKPRRSKWGIGLNVAALIVGLASAGFAVWVYTDAREEKIPLWYCESRSLVAPVGAGTPGISVAYNGHTVPQVTSTSVWLWNAGKRTIEGTDIAGGDRLRIKLPTGASILSARVVKVHRQTVQPRLFTRDGFVYLSFDFMDRQDGFVVQVLHTGPAGERARVVGTLKGSNPLLFASSKSSSSIWPLVVIVIEFCIIFVAAFVYRRQVARDYGSRYRTFMSAACVLAGCGVVVAAAILCSSVWHGASNGLPVAFR